jgi:DNA-binding IclR family transcriptional regulator
MAQENVSVPGQGSSESEALSTKPSSDGYSVRAIVRAVELLELVRSTPGGEVTLRELSKRSGLAKASVFRLLRTLETVGLVERLPESEQYRLGVRCLEFGQAYLEQIDLRKEALPVMERLREEFNETVHLAVLDDRLRVVYLEKLDSAHAVGIMMSRVGRTAPSFCTGIGKALLAARRDDAVSVLAERRELHRFTPNTICDPHQLREELEQIRTLGYSVDLEEHEPGVRCVAASIAAPRTAPGAALSIAGPAQRLPQKLLRGKLASAVMSAAAEIAARMGTASERHP